MELLSLLIFDPFFPNTRPLCLAKMSMGLEAYPVSTEVNNVRNNGRQLTDPLPAS